MAVSKPDYTKYAGWTRGEMIRTIEALITRQTNLLNRIARLEPDRPPPEYDAGFANGARETTAAAGSVTDRLPLVNLRVTPRYGLPPATRYPWETDDDK